jgi:hypothetical protein
MAKTLAVPSTGGKQWYKKSNSLAHKAWDWLVIETFNGLKPNEGLFLFSSRRSVINLKISEYHMVVSG